MAEEVICEEVEQPMVMAGALPRVHPPTGGRGGSTGDLNKVGRGRAGSFCIQQLHRWIQVPAVCEGPAAAAPVVTSTTTSSSDDHHATAVLGTKDSKGVKNENKNDSIGDKNDKQKKNEKIIVVSSARARRRSGSSRLNHHNGTNNGKVDLDHVNGDGSSNGVHVNAQGNVGAAARPFRPPSSRSGQSLCRAGSFAFVFGGCGYLDEDINNNGSNSSNSNSSNSISSSRSSSVYGRVKAQCLNDMHCINLDTLRWAPVNPSNSAAAAAACIPSVRTCAAMCASDDGKFMYLSGGASDDPDDLQADLYCYDVRKHEWTCLFKAPADKVKPGEQEDEQIALGRSACSRIGHSMMYLQFSSGSVISAGKSDSGGGSGGRIMNSNHRFVPAGTSSAGQPRRHYSDDYRADTHLVTFGGSTGYDYFNDVILFNLMTHEWSCMTTTGEAPSPRYKQQAFVDNTVLYVMGGGAYEPRDGIMEVYALDLSTAVWSLLDVKAICSPPKERAAHSVAFDSATRTAYLWGGFTSDMELSQRCCALKLDGLEWIEVGVKEHEEDEYQGYDDEDEEDDKEEEDEDDDHDDHGADNDSSGDDDDDHDGSDDDEDEQHARAYRRLRDRRNHRLSGRRGLWRTSSDGGIGGSGGGGFIAQRDRRHSSSSITAHRGGSGHGGGVSRRVTAVTSRSKARARAMALMQRLQDFPCGVESSPPIRSFHASCFYKGSHYIFGGSNGMEKFNDVWRFTEVESVPTLSALAARTLVTSYDAAELEGMMTSVDLPEELRYGINHINIIADRIF